MDNILLNVKLISPLIKQQKKKNKTGETPLKLAKNAETASALQPIAKGRLWEDNEVEKNEEDEDD